jgi:hypothetical protein
MFEKGRYKDNKEVTGRRNRTKENEGIQKWRRRVLDRKNGHLS